MIRRSPPTPSADRARHRLWLGRVHAPLLEATPGAMGIGIDLDNADLARRRANAEARNLSD